jgi:pSer/pThr/pTyr-binding forkhead associated (FHA) protein
VHLSSVPVVIGRVPECDIMLADERVSRRHCEIRYWDGSFVIKNLKSQNGITVNGERIEIAVLKPGDMIKVGSTVLTFEERKSLTEESALRQIEGEMQEGKGYRTILREIVQDIELQPPGHKAPKDIRKG